MQSFIQRRVLSEDLEFAMKDATEALLNAVAMRDWKGVKKYADQLIVMAEKGFKADRDKASADHEKAVNTPGTWQHHSAQFKKSQK